jgi:hypothetical protein
MLAVSLEGKRLPGERRAKVEARAALLIRRRDDLARPAPRARSHAGPPCRELGVKQETVSRLEQRSDMFLSTLRGYVEAMGGELDLIAKFPSGVPLDGDKMGNGRRRVQTTLIGAPTIALPFRSRLILILTFSSHI